MEKEQEEEVEKEVVVTKEVEKEVVVTVEVPAEAEPAEPTLMRIGNTDEIAFLDAMRVRSFPFNDEVKRYIEEHEQVFVIEQNRDAQLRTLLMAEFEFGPDKLKSVLCFDGTPISARNIRKQIKAHLNGDNVTPLHRNIVASGAGDNQ